MAVISTLLLINIFLAKSKTKIEQGITDYIDQKISIDTIVYSFPSSFMLKNVSLFKDKTPKAEILISIEKIKLDISLPGLVIKQRIIPKNIIFDKIRADYFKCASFLSENFARIQALIESLPKNRPIKIVVKTALFSLPHKDTGVSYVIINSASQLKNRKITSSGSIAMKYNSTDKTNNLNADFDMQPLRYNLTGFLSKNSATMEDIELKNDNFYMKLWGVFEKSVLRLHGFASLSDFFKTQISQETRLSIVEQFKLLFKKQPDSIAFMLKSKSNLTIAYINCLMKITPLAIQLENLSFSINNLPLRLKGSIGFIPPASIDLTFSSYPYQPKKSRLANPRRFNLKITGNLKEKGFNGRLWIEFLKKVRGAALSQSIDTILSNASMRFPGSRHINISFDQADIKYTSGNNIYKTMLYNLSTLLHIKNNKLKFLELSSLMYDGSLKADGLIDFSSSPFRYAFKMDIDNITSNRLASLLVHLSKIEGKATSQIHFRNFPRTSLNGNITIHDGRLNDFEFFKWLADFFSLPSLYKINFDTLSMDFFVDDNGARLDKINLDSEEITLDGYFRQYKNNLVASKISLGLPKELLASSPKFAPLLRILGGDFKLLQFDFQLSGILNAMNFKWLESDFKLKLQDSIPNFIEKKIERKIEAAIKPIYENP